VSLEGAYLLAAALGVPPFCQPLSAGSVDAVGFNSAAPGSPALPASIGTPPCVPAASASVPSEASAPATPPPSGDVHSVPPPRQPAASSKPSRDERSRARAAADRAGGVCTPKGTGQGYTVGQGYPICGSMLGTVLMPVSGGVAFCVTVCRLLKAAGR